MKITFNPIKLDLHKFNRDDVESNKSEMACDRFYFRTEFSTIMSIHFYVQRVPKARDIQPAY